MNERHRVGTLLQREHCGDVEHIDKVFHAVITIAALNLDFAEPQQQETCMMLLL